MMATEKEITERAKDWLMKSVKEKTTRLNFRIVDLVEVMYEETRIAICFHCTYEWMVNAWKKDVDTNINVIYVPEEDSFHSDDPVIFE